MTCKCKACWQRRYDTAAIAYKQALDELVRARAAADALAKLGEHPFDAHVLCRVDILAGAESDAFLKAGDLQYEGELGFFSEVHTSDEALPDARTHHCHQGASGRSNQ